MQNVKVGIVKLRKNTETCKANGLKSLQIAKTMILNYKLLNPLFFYLLMLMQDKTIRNIILFGGSSSGKTYSMAQAILILTLYEGSNTLVMRKVGASIRDTVYQDFKSAADQLCISHLFKFNDGNKVITCLQNKARIVFKGVDDAEKIKGLSSFKRIVLDEWSEFDEADYKQLRLRLRGMEGQQIICTFNPIKETHWIKKKVFDVQKWHDVPMAVRLGDQLIPEELTKVKSIKMNEPRVIMHKRTGEMIEHSPDTVVIQTTYLNNFWVVGSPDGTYGYYDEQCIATFEYDREHDPDYYNVYALGEWGVIRSGSEFFGSFNRGNHVAPVEYDPALPVHICVDSNVLPYISISYWQIAIEGTNNEIRQIGETCAESPNNTVRKAAKLVAKRLREMGVCRVILHGDASTRASNNIDDEKRSFHDLFIDTLQKEGIEVEDRVSGKNPSVPMSGEFINAILDKMLPGLNIVIGECCPISIEDYMSVQKDVNGGILKTKVKNKITMQTYEEHGHLSDTFRYIVIDALKEQFLLFSNRRKRNLYARDGVIHFYNPTTKCTYTEDLVYCMPNINGRFVFMYGKKCGEYWHISSVRFMESSSTEDMKAALTECESSRIILECSKSYYIMARDLRDNLSGDVRVVHESCDLQRRISATSDFVKTSVLFNEKKMEEDVEYADFMANLLDYNKDNENIESSAVISGFAQAVLKLGL